tara:strand:- start:444 stop:1850 length:1407 start_codon:yes stop_codon:yes gene_type:complete
VLADSLLTRLRDALGDDRVLTSDEDVADRRHDYWVLSHLQAWRGTFDDRPGAVVRPRSTADVQAVVRLAAETGTAVVPFGLGSGVCGGIRPDQGMLLADLSSMDRIRNIDDVNLVASFDAGANGLVAEEAVAERGLTIGHWPQSIALSTVGGWVSTRAAGQFSTAYGNIEDMVYALEVVLPDGTLVELGRAPRAAAGPDLRHIFLGAEGTFGIITGVTLALHRQPEARTWRAFHTPSLAAGLDAQRRIMQAGWKPPVMRQYDAREARRSFKPWSTKGQGMLLMAHEGPAGRVDAEVAAVDDLAGSCELTRADDEVGPHWMENRNHVPAWEEFFEQGLVVDTIEVSGPWTAVEAIYDAVLADVGALNGVVAVSAHSSHAYRTGVNLYFTFASAGDAADLEAAYLACWHAVMEATARHGGGVAHHHGIGRVRRPYLVHDLGEAGVDLLRTLRGAVDPQGIMNPGNLIPDA